MDTEWAVEQLSEFLDLFNRPAGSGTWRGTQEQRASSLEIIERILDNATPAWRETVPRQSGGFFDRWEQPQEAAQRARAVLSRADELEAKLGPAVPRLSAATLHPWVWDGARSLWASGHYREAVGAASRKVNAETQNKLGRRDVSEADLFKQAFSLDPPKPGAARFRLADDDGGKTYTNLQRGAIAYADGCYTAIRNPAAHEDTDDLAESVALEQLAAFSVLARWVDAARVLTAPPG